VLPAFCTKPAESVLPRAKLTLSQAHHDCVQFLSDPFGERSPLLRRIIDGPQEYLVVAVPKPVLESALRRKFGVDRSRRRFTTHCAIDGVTQQFIAHAVHFAAAGMRGCSLGLAPFCFRGSAHPLRPISPGTCASCPRSRKTCCRRNRESIRSLADQETRSQAQLLS
jgi:hypothetical protein